MAMTRGVRELVIVIVVSVLAFGIAVSVLNVNANRETRANQERIRREVAAEVAKTNSALCAILEFSASPRPRPPQPVAEPTSPFGKQLAEYNRQQAESQAKGRTLVLAAIEKYNC